MEETIKLNLLNYVSNIIKFMSITVFDILPQVFGMMFFNLAKEQEKMGVLGFLISSFYFFFCLTFNHSEVINLKSGLYFSKGDFLTANKNIIQCILVNLLFYVFSVVIVYQCKHIFVFFGLYGDFLVTVSYYVPIYCLCIGTLFMISCMLRGKHLIRYNDHISNAITIFKN
jgi:hypothetical protein